MKTRLLGIDLFRGIAAYAVILVHSGDATWGLPINQAAENFRLLFYFAVPFFIAVSFYLMVNRPHISISRKFWRSRIERILIPYGIWTILYFVLKLALFPLTNQTNQVNSFLQDPWGIIFFGGISYHLYFLPLIFVGSSLVILARYLQKNSVDFKNLCLLFIFSLISYQILIWSGNSFKLGPNIAFFQLLKLLDQDSPGYTIIRLIFVVLAWLIRCLPYLLGAIVYIKLDAKTYRLLEPKVRVIFWLIIFLLLDILGKAIIPLAFWEIVVSFSLLNLAVALSRYIKKNSLIINLGQCSFGIYLIHPLMKSSIEIVLNQLVPAITQSVSITSMLVYSGLTFMTSWYVVSISLNNKLIAKYIFGA